MSIENKSQIDRFRKTAREVGADESDDALDKVFGKLDMKRKPEEKPEKKGPLLLGLLLRKGG